MGGDQTGIIGLQQKKKSIQHTFKKYLQIKDIQKMSIKKY